MQYPNKLHHDGLTCMWTYVLFQVAGFLEGFLAKLALVDPPPIHSFCGNRILVDGSLLQAGQLWVSARVDIM